MPASLQQLRLRNLLQVFGYNIKSDYDSDSMLYFTLHATSMSPPFYTSKMAKKTKLKSNTTTEVSTKYIENGVKLDLVAILISILGIISETFSSDNIQSLGANDRSNEILFLVSRPILSIRFQSKLRLCCQ